MKESAELIEDMTKTIDTLYDLIDKLENQCSLYEAEIEVYQMMLAQYREALGVKEHKCK